MKAKDLIDKKSEILEPLHSLATELSQVDARGKGHLLEYTKLDVVAAAVVFIHVMANKKAHIYLKTRTTSVEDVRKEMESYGNRIREIVKEMTDINLDEKAK